MPRLSQEELRDQHERDLTAWAELKARLMDEEHVDDDGYPTDAALALIEKWHWTDCGGLFDFVKSIWHLASWGWREVDASALPTDSSEYNKNGGAILLISTAGWSGNESIIRALQDNWMAWSLCWIQSRRGGHYIFKLHELKDDE